MKVIKFGGTSVATADAIKKSAQVITHYYYANQPVAVVVSALGGVTNKLLEAGRAAATPNQDYQSILSEIENRHFGVVTQLVSARQQSSILAQVKILLNKLEEMLYGIRLLAEFSPRISDTVASFGERLSAYIISEYLKHIDVNAEFCDTRQIIRTNSNYGKAIVDFEVTNHLVSRFFADNRGKVVIATGFIGSDAHGHTTTLGRGGSDYTAAILGSALRCKEIEIWTDVDGMMTADPRMVRKAFSLKNVSYIEAMELSHFGAKVIYPPTLQPAFELQIPIRVRNTFNPEFEGTVITNHPGDNRYLVKGISSMTQMAVINVQGSGLVGVAGISAKLFGALARAEVSVALITQASSEHSISFAINASDALKAVSAIKDEFAYEIDQRMIEEISYTLDNSIIALVGENMKERPGIAAQVFTSLARQGINVTAIAQGSSELNISVVINQAELPKAMNALHETFFLSELKTIHLFLIGPGLIGGTLLKQIERQGEYLARTKRIQVKLAGICDHIKMLIDENIETANAIELLNQKGEPTNLSVFTQRILELNNINSVVADCTASPLTVNYYKTLLSQSVSIVTPNKIANSGRLSQYLELQEVAQENNSSFLYETNVGAGLPIINTLKNLIDSGDEVIKIEAIVSGTLSFLFNTFKPGDNFADLVRQAKKIGFTEPDPRQDLSGTDMARKALILARESGLMLEMEDVKISGLLPQSCIDAPSVDDFFVALDNEKDVFGKLIEEAAAKGNRLRYVAKIENGAAEIKLIEVEPSHPFYGLEGSDNIVAFTTHRYKNNPLVVKGPGAGAEVTAAGIFSEIISIIG